VAGDIDCGEAAGNIEETMAVPGAVLVVPYDLTAIVDPLGGGASLARACLWQPYFTFNCHSDYCHSD
jgi:hypothetical protein